MLNVDYLLYICNEFQVPNVLGCVLMAQLSKRAIDIILPQKRGKFLISKGNGNMLTFGIIVPFTGNDIPQYVGYCFIIG